MRPPAARHTSCLSVALLAMLALLSGCASQRPDGRSTPLAPIPGYLGDRTDLAGLDTQPLRGRHILLDPGHGGFFRGALGPEGLTEAEVNLGVALYLRGMLEWAGAEVFLTRSADVDFLSPADSTLTGDLAFRVSLIDSLQPDVFLSIHHNSTASRDPEINETQTYYPLGDDGASLDLARSIHRHLVGNLGIRPAKILPGNFHVLRDATVPAVLGEPAMISNPVIEGRLGLAASHELEAQAYFLGLLDYFSRGRPRWHGPTASGDTLQMAATDPGLALHFTFEADNPPRARAPGPDPTTFNLKLDGRRQGFDLSPDGRNLTWRPTSDPGPGIHRLELRGRNLAGRATPVHVVHLRTGQGLLVELELIAEAAPSGVRVLRWRSGDGRPLPAGFLLGNRGHNLPTPPTAEGFFLLAGDRDDTAWRFQVRGAQDAYPAPIATERTLPVGTRLRLATTGEEPAFGSSHRPPLGWQRRLPQPGSPPGSPVIIQEEDQAVWVEASGLMPLVQTGAGPGTVPAETALWRPRLLLPALFGRTIVLDPAGGGTEDQGRFPLGDRGADWNLQTARHLKTLLEGAGARVRLTRQAEEAPDPRTKVLLEKDSGADLFLTIGRAPASAAATVAHHPGSVLGQRGARALARALGPLDPCTVSPSYAYLLRHTSCPALEVRLPSPAGPPEERILGSTARQMAQARAMLLACAAIFAPDGDLPPTMTAAQAVAVLPSRPDPAELDRALWDGNFPWQPPHAAPGSWQEGPESLTSWKDIGWPARGNVHTLELHRGGHWQLWRLENRKGGWQTELMMENR